MVDITRRTFILGAIAGVGLAVADNTLTARAGMLPARTRTLFGAFCGPDRYPNVNPTEEKWEMQAAVRARMGGALGVELIFNEGRWDVPHLAGAAGIVSFTQDPADVAAGVHDAHIRGFVQGVHALGITQPWWLCLNHECDQDSRPYSPADQVDGFRRFSDLVRDECDQLGETNIKLTTILMSWTLTRGKDVWRQWYPGPEYVDALGWDAYFRPNIAHEPEDVYGPAITVTQAEGRRLLICETSLGAKGAGGTGFTDQQWTDYTHGAIQLLDNTARAVTWFETNKVDGDWRLANHPTALAAYATAVQASIP